ncbi:MAG: hypothetical protein NTU54_04645 [Candidatus Omnitrophica bacterium]|nr:hypothetical protein [Candidatus Omnitrophota bacterium]
MGKKLLLILSVFLFAGCASGGNSGGDSNGSIMSRSFSSSQVTLDKNNFRMVKANAQGASSGFYLFGIIPFVSPHRTVAMARLYESGGIRDAKAYALINVDQERSSTYLILFSVPTYRVRADIVEFIDSGK